MTQIVVETNDMAQLSEIGGKFVFKKDAEDAIRDLLTLKEMVEHHLELVKQAIAEAGEQANPNFKGVIGDSVKAIYRTYGEKYTYDVESVNDLIEQGFIKKNEQYKVNSPAVDTYVKRHKQLPSGIGEKERTKVISLIKIDYEQTPVELQPHATLGSGKT